MFTTCDPLHPFPSVYVRVQAVGAFRDSPGRVKKTLNPEVAFSPRFAAPGTTNGILSKPFCGAYTNPLVQVIPVMVTLVALAGPLSVTEKNALTTELLALDW